MRRSRIMPLAGDNAISGVNIVPVIDLCLVLLVILLVVSPMLDKPPFDVALPKAETKEEKENNITVSIAPDGRLAVKSDSVAREELEGYLKTLLYEQGEDTVVIINADESVQYGDLTSLLAAVKKAGARRISLGTKTGKGGA